MNLWPDWNSIDSVKAWHTFFEISGIVVLALLVIAEVFAFGFGKRLEALTHQIESARVAADERNTKTPNNATRRRLVA